MTYHCDPLMIDYLRSGDRVRYCGWTQEVHTHPMDPPDYATCENFATGPDLLCDEHRAEQIRQAEYAEAWARDYVEQEEW